MNISSSGETPRVPFFDCTPNAATAEKLAKIAAEVIESGVYVGGSYVAGFEDELARFLGGGHVVAVGNGLDALTLALMALDIGPGDEVIVPSYSFIATWTAVARVGATCVVADVESSTGLVNLDAVLSKLSPATKAFIPVHLYGASVHLSEIRDTLAERNVQIVEDCAQSIGASEPGGMTGTLGTMAAFSFYPTKNLGALGDGGAVFTKSEVLAERLRSLRSYGFQGSRYQFSMLGVNSRLDAIQAAFLSEKLSGTAVETQNRRRQANLYLANAAEGGLKSVAQHPGESVFHHFPLLAGDRNQVISSLAGFGVEADMHYPYTFEAFAAIPGISEFKLTQSDIENAKLLAMSVVTLPIGSWLSPDQESQVSFALKSLAGTL